ncbi:winged helix-turn-helix transcriptional regulator [Kribbella sandramycini]|uniref:DNA-binding response OmpR family regulator n=1 Tax=Kribbella sandramycini TaxID=60450 RepID=A0A7Y4L3X7_9ACTN|nr:winged helix-turn-helix domain-containing protein [Kribbella sandramycini]MBB6570757.1 DNA-binding response OmpR family regulator [Kribbella sandramycini]NOL43898.1 winged helix-turn-helix transcriptional regulator [Kribbella sandramycini]
MEGTSESSLIIGVATSTAERVQLARLLGDADALLLVSSAEQARVFLELTESLSATAAPVVVAPSVVPQLDQPAPTDEELFLDVERRTVRWRDREVPLTRLEHDFLHCLVEEPGRVWTYQRLHHAVWGNEHLGHGSHIHSVVKRLRQKLAELGATVTIHAVRGVGFHLLPTT